jgi:general secretion pathway protein N
VALPVDQVAAPPPPVAGPERPMLALIGAVVGDSDAIAVFLDRTTQKIVRLRQGDTHAGWVLSSVQGREVTFKKADQIETLGIQRQEAPAPPAGAGVPMPAPAAATPVSGGFDTSYAPFAPRSTPKNGESDGL